MEFSDYVEQCRNSFHQAVQGMLRALETTPDERLNWSPSESARTPLQVAGHAATAVGNMLGNLKGETFEIPDTFAAEKHFREDDLRYTSMEVVKQVLDRNTAAYMQWLDNLKPEQLQESMLLPFGMGSIPIEAGISFMPVHINWHTAQLHYIQTIYGDRDWHL